MTSQLEIELNDIRGIKKLNVSLNLTPGIYAITGENATGKSSLIASLAAIFYRRILTTYFQNSSESSIIKYSLDSNKMMAVKENSSNHWNFEGDLRLNGFYEGSIIHGNRFRDTNFSALFRASKVKTENLTPAEDFVKENLGVILKDDASYYNELYRLKAKDAYSYFKFNGSPYFLVNENSDIISQFSLSTGENLLISLLHSINFQLIIKTKKEHYIVLLDEIELALHPRALVRLVKFLKQLSKDRNIAIYFSTHSVELIRQVSPNNIYYLEKLIDNTVDVINPCYPSYATRNISFFDGYDLLVLVEDHLARTILEWIIRNHNLNTSKLIHILPVGGWENTLSLHCDIFDSELLGYKKSVISILDGDIENEFKSKYLNKGKYSNLNVSFLQIPSIEKYLLDKLIKNIDYKFTRHFGDAFFKKKSLTDIVREYQKNKKGKDDGKALFNILVSEATSVNRADEEFVTMISNYIVETTNTDNLADRLKAAIK